MKKREVYLIYQETIIKDSGSKSKKETKKLVACNDTGNFSSKYYLDRERNMQKSNNISIMRTYLADNLLYVEYGGKRYEIANVLNDNTRGERYCILDIEEYKR